MRLSEPERVLINIIRLLVFIYTQARNMISYYEFNSLLLKGGLDSYKTGPTTHSGVPLLK
jgi:hypothetical protein